jgi:hypothetical protein
MVGHTGIEEAAIKAVETVDECIGRVVDEVRKVNGTIFITADHGNAEQMVDYETGDPHTAHTTNLVPIVAVGLPEGTKLKEGMLRIRNNADEFMLSLGYRNNRQEGYHIAENPNNDRVALFAHEGFGIAFLSSILNIPYPLFSTHFAMCHTGVTVVEFRDEGGVVFPKVLTYSNEAHLYEKRVPLSYNAKI